MLYPGTFIFVLSRHIVAGAMRLPGTGTKNWTGPSHYLTDFYANEFKVKTQPFVNYCEHGYYRFYDQTPVKINGKAAALIYSSSPLYVTLLIQM